MALLDYVQDYPGEPASERQNQKGKTNLDLLEQEIHTHTTVLRLCGICPGKPG